EYEIALDLKSSEPGDVAWRLRFVPPQANDQFANRFSLSGVRPVTTGSTLGASKELAEPDFPDAVGGHSVWWTWTAPADGFVTVNCESGFPSEGRLMAVYMGDSLESLTRIAS